MYTNLTKYCLWDLLPPNLKVGDLDTTQMLYEGENRGQTQRFMVTCGDLIVDMFQKVDSMLAWKDPYLTPLSMLQYLQRELYARFIVADAGSEALVREILAEIYPAWKLKGTRAFLHWIIWKIYGWRVTGIISLASSVLKLSVFTSRIFDRELPDDAQKVLYDPDLMSPDDKLTLVIDVFSDVDFDEKKETLEQLLNGWSYPCEVQYVNTP